VAHRRFDTDKYYFTIVDCPGHRDFVKNMITGASQADAAILVVDAKDGVQAQTKEHVFLSKTLGINQMIVAINKMDSVKYSEDRFKEVKKEVGGLLKMVSYKTDKMSFIPVSAYKGDNIVKLSDNTPWYKDLTILKALDTIEKPGIPVDLPLRLPVQDVYTISGVGTVPVGRVETGKMKKGDKVIFQPADIVGEIKSIEMHHEEMPEALPGDNIGFNVRGVARKDLRRGDVCGHLDTPPTVAEEFTAQIVILQHPTAVTVGYTPVFHCYTTQVACTFIELQKKLDPKTGQVVEENPTFLKSGDAAIVKIRPTRPFVIERAKDIPQLGRFAVRDMGMTIAAGICLDVKKK
jgi:elongation factor 1-alpha